MMPGARARPSASTVCLATPRFRPILAILPSLTPRSPCTGLPPVPSKISAFLITRSNMRGPPFASLYYASRPLLLIVVLLLCGSGAKAQPVHFPSVAVGGAPAGPEITGWLYRPEGSGAFPAIVLAHTCAGVNAHTETWGKRLASWGYVTVAPDSFGPRGLKSVCGRGNAVSGNMR